MKKYSLILSKIISNNTKIPVYELCKNNESIFELFADEIEKNGNLLPNLATAVKIIEDTSNLIRKPQNKFKQLNISAKNIKLYEAKAGSIRVYLIQEVGTGRVIISGGLKGNQKKDIKKTISIINDYYNEQ